MEMHHSMDAGHENTSGRKWLKYLAIGTALTAGTIILLPYALPHLGIGASNMADFAADKMHGKDSGLAGGINSLFTLVPVIGESLAKGGWTSAITSGAFGIGGVLLGRYVGKRENGKHFIKWSSVITTAALMTSALIALPPLLTSISVGIVFLSQVISGPHLATLAGDFLAKTLGGAAHSHAAAGAAGLAATGITHLLTCGMAILPVSIAWLMGTKKPAEEKHSDAGQAPDILARIETDKSATPGVPCIARLRLVHADSGAPLTAEELAVAHEAKIHLFIADSSLKDYHHIHPARTDEPGVFAFTFTPRTANNYSAWTDFTLAKSGENHRIREIIPSASGRTIPPTIRPNRLAQADGMTFSWKCSDEALTKGTPSIVEISVHDAQGRPMKNLEPVMGAFAHLVGFGADGQTFIHTHPLDEPVNAEDRGGPRLRFHVEPGISGPVQFYLHVKQGGKELYVPFGQHIKPPELNAAKALDHRPAMHAQHGM